jgi:hypothetical protein
MSPERQEYGNHDGDWREELCELRERLDRQLERIHALEKWQAAMLAVCSALGTLLGIAIAIAGMLLK